MWESGLCMWKKELRPTWGLGFPIIVGNLSQMMMGLVDTLMIGRVGTVELGAAAFANSVVFLLFVIGIGIAVAVSVQVAQAHGRGDGPAAGEALRHGAVLALAVAGLLALLLSSGMPIYRMLGQPEAVLEAMPAYLGWLAWSLVPALVGMCFKNFAEAKASPWTVLWITMAGVGLNVFLNWVFIFGNLGSPALGLAGAGMATFLARVATMTGLILYVLREPIFASARPVRWGGPIRWGEVKNLLRIGIPMGFQMLVEVGAFVIATILIGILGTIPLAAHQIAINCAAMAFMVPLGLSTAVTIRVGHAIGAGEINRARHITTGALISATAFMSGTALLFLSAGEYLAAAFSPDLAVVTLAAKLLIIAGIFQIGDGIQIISMGALRGLKDVRRPTWLMVLIYWLVALPLGAVLNFATDLGALGMWTGLATGLGFAATVLTWRCYGRLGIAEKSQVETRRWVEGSVRPPGADEKKV
jgi:multidrug resistance protein, MATE family